MIGVITGLRSEARCLPPAAGRVIICSGADPGRARQAAQTLVDQGAVGLISFGIAGGLDPAARPGDIVLPQAVLLPGGEHIPTSDAWREQFERRLSASGPRVHQGSLAGSDRLLVSGAEKCHVRGINGALAADLESHAVAQAAARAGLPFVVIRAIADPLEQRLPAAARVGIGSKGEVRVLSVLKVLCASPGDLWPLLRLGWQSARAHASLRRVALLAGAALSPN
jgi:hopanoid-associated phosphorylase